MIITAALHWKDASDRLTAALMSSRIEDVQRCHRELLDAIVKLEEACEKQKEKKQS